MSILGLAIHYRRVASRRGHDLTGGMCVNSGTVKEREKDRLTLLNL